MGRKKFNPAVCKNKHFCELLVSDKAEVSRGFPELKEDFGLADSTGTKAFIKVNTVSSEMFIRIRSFQVKILNNITFTNSRLAKIGQVMFKTILAHFVELAQKLLIISFMIVFILTSFEKISKNFGSSFLVNMLKCPCKLFC